MVDTYLKCNYTLKANCSFSFNPNTMQCLCCLAGYGHHVLGKTGEDGALPGRLLFLITDQAGPPTLTTSEDCVRVIRQELGDLNQLMRLFLSTIRRLPIPRVA